MATGYLKKKGMKALLTGAVCAGALGFSGGASAGTVYLDWGGSDNFDSLETGSVMLGQTVNASVFVRLDAGTDPIGLDNLISWGVELNLATPSIASYSTNSFSADTAWNFATSCRDSSSVACDTATSPNPIRTLGEANTGSGQDAVTANVKLFDIAFTGDSVGTTNINLSILNDWYGEKFDTFFGGNTVDSYNNHLTFDNTSLSVVTAVPIPPAFLLFLPAVIGLLRARKISSSTST